MQRNVIIGTAAALAVVCFWTGVIIFSRHAVTHSLTVYDLAGLRFTVAGLIVLPWMILKKPWRGLTIGRIILLHCGSGLPYTFLTFFGLYYAPAAHGGVFLNGFLPVLTALVAWWWIGERRTPWQIAGLIIIVAGVVLVGWDGLSMPTTGAGGGKAWLGDLLFLAAISIFAVFMVANRLWAISTSQVVFCVAFLSAVIYVPIWLIFFEKNLAATPWSEIIIQGVFQGLVPTVLGLSCLSIAVRNIGANAASVFFSVVPAATALAGYLILGEELGSPSWLGMVVVTSGILLALGLKKSH